MTLPSGTLQLDVDLATKSADSSCPTIGAVVGDLDGVRFDTLTQGSGSYDPDGTFDGCYPPTLSGPIAIPTGGASTLTIADSSATVTVRFAPNALVARYATPPHDGWEFNAGEHVELDWSVPDDISSGRFAWITFEPDTNGAGGDLCTQAACIAADGKLAIDVPLDFHGAGLMDFGVGILPPPPPTACEGAATCTLVTDDFDDPVHAALIH